MTVLSFEIRRKGDPAEAFRILNFLVT
jgi:hypothetical protein